MKLCRDAVRPPRFLGIDLAAFFPILPMMPTVRFWWGHWWFPVLFGLGPIVMCAVANYIYRKPVSWFFWRALHLLRGNTLAACPWWMRRALCTVRTR
jgi:hypothetical protein